MRVLVVVTAALILLACNKEYEAGSVPHLFAYGQTDILRAVSPNAPRPGSVREVRRNGDGTALYVHVPTDGGEEVIVLRKKQPPVTVRIPGVVGFLNDSLGIVAWSDDLKSGLTFPGGLKVKLRPHGAAGTDPSGSFFFAETEDGRTALGRTTDPIKPVGLSAYRGHKLFWKSPSLYVFGHEGASTSVLICEIWREQEGRFAAVDKIRIQRPSSGNSPWIVVDMDPWSDDVLLKDTCDVPCSSKWVLFSLSSQRTAELGRANDYGVFLAGDVVGSQH